jgi:hypothetical protein
MINFLRKHQKKFLIVVSVVIITSFTFFGVATPMQLREKIDKEIGKDLEGYPITERELNGMVEFLTLPSSTILSQGLIESGLMAMLAEKHFSHIQEDFKQKLDKAKKFTLYSHPQAPFLNALNVWNTYTPKIPKHLDAIKQGDVNEKTFIDYCHLYTEQMKFPPQLLMRILQYQQKQYSWIYPDHNLNDYTKMTLFGADSFEQWFGPKLTTLVAKFFFQAANIAQSKGFQVSIQEARQDLLQKCLESLQISSYPDSKTTPTELLRSRLQMLGLDETEAVKIWRKALLAKRLFATIEQGILVDPLIYNQFSSFANEKATIQTYQFPKELQIHDFQSLLKFFYYLQAVTPEIQQKNTLLPKVFLSAAEVEQNNPHLVFSHYTLEFAQVTKEEIANLITLKETWNYELSDDGWEKLSSLYPILIKDGERLKILEGLTPTLRQKVDKSARDLLIDDHPEWIESALEKATLQKITIDIPSEGKVSSPFQDMADTTKLKEFLENIPLEKQSPLFTTDNKTFYKIIVLSKSDCKKIMTFKQALSSGCLEDLLKKKLDLYYQKIRKKSPKAFQEKDGSWKPFATVADKLGFFLFFSDSITKNETQTYDDYASEYLMHWMETAKSDLKQNGENSIFVQKTEDLLVDQCKLNITTLEIKRSDSSTLSKKEIFTMPLDTWSSTTRFPNGDLTFFKLVKKEISSPDIENKVTFGQQLLTTDAKRLLMKQLLEKIDESQ